MSHPDLQTNQEVSTMTRPFPLSEWLDDEHDAPWAGGIDTLALQPVNFETESDTEEGGYEPDLIMMDEGLLDTSPDDEGTLAMLEGSTAVMSVQSIPGRDQSEMMENETISTQIDTEHIWMVRDDGWTFAVESQEQNIYQAFDPFLTQGFEELEANDATELRLPPSIAEQACIIADQEPDISTDEAYQEFLKRPVEEQDR